MDLIYLTNARIPTEKAHGGQIMRMCDAFARDATVTLVAPRRWNSRKLAAVRDIFSFYGTAKSFRIYRLPTCDILPLMGRIPFLESMAFVLQYGSFLFFVYAYLLLVFFKRRKVGATVYTRDVRLARLALRFTKNVFFELHTIPKPDDVFVANGVLGVITVTRKLKEKLVHDGVPEEKVIVAPDATDPAIFDRIAEPIAEIRKSLHLPLDAKLIGYVGRLKTLEQEKGIPELIEAFGLLQSAHPDSRLIVVGGNASDAASYAGYLDKYHLRPRVHFIPHIDPGGVPRYLKAMDILVAPFPKSEHYAYAMSPLKIFEYMASGRPMVVSRLPALEEVLTDATATFCEPGDAKGLADALAGVLQDTAAASKKAHNAHELARQYTWDKRAAAIQAFIMEKIGNTNP